MLRSFSSAFVVAAVVLAAAPAHATEFLKAIEDVPLVAGLFGALFAVLLGYVTTKKAGTPFAMITLGVGELVAAIEQLTGQPANLSYSPNAQIETLFGHLPTCCKAIDNPTQGLPAKLAARPSTRRHPWHNHHPPRPRSS